MASKIVDPTTPGLSLELPPIWLQWLNELDTAGKLLNSNHMYKEFEDDQIVGLVYLKGKYTYFATDSDFWFLDQHLVKKAFEQNGHSFPEIPASFRNGLHQVTPNDGEAFINALEKNKTSNEELKANIQQYGRHDLVPSVFVDFDNKAFKSFHSEPYGFEKYVGEEWVSSYEDFEQEIPEPLRYWETLNS